MSSVKEYFKSLGNGFASLIKGLSVTGKEFVTPKITERYPEDRDTYKWPERFRACLELVYDKEGKNEMGTVLSVQSVPYSEICYNHTDGSAYMADNPDYSNFIVTVRTSGSHTESGYHAGSVRILVGLDINVRLGSFSGSAECIGIREIG